MLEYIKNWIEGIIIAIIIGTIIEMIIPNCNLKKYIKIIIGTYIMLNLVSPIIGLFSGKTMSFSIDNYKSYYMDSNVYDGLKEDLIKENNEQIENVYKEALIDDIKTKINEKLAQISNLIKYKIHYIDVMIDTSNDDEYGKIKNIQIILEKVNKENVDNKNDATNISNKNKIKKVAVSKISTSNNVSNLKNKNNTYNSEYNKKSKNKSSNKQIPNNDTEQVINILKEFISDEYGVNITSIKIDFIEGRDF